MNYSQNLFWVFDNVVVMVRFKVSFWILWSRRSWDDHYDCVTWRWGKNHGSSVIYRKKGFYKSTMKFFAINWKFYSNAIFCWCELFLLLGVFVRGNKVCCETLITDIYRKPAGVVDPCPCPCPHPNASCKHFIEVNATSHSSFSLLPEKQIFN